MNRPLGEPIEMQGETRIWSLWQGAEAAFKRGAYAESADLWQEILDRCDRRLYTPGDARLGRSVSRRLANLPQTRASIEDYRKGRAERPPGAPRIAVFTSLIGGYDSVKIPENPDPRFDYILFTDRPLSGGGVWEVRPSPLVCSCDARASRFVKMHPHVLLPDYDVAIYIDSNIMLIGDLGRPLAAFLDFDEPLGAVQHPFRENIYQEIEACVAYHKDGVASMIMQVRPYYREGFTHSDLVEANLLFFKLQHPKIPIFLSRWWAEMERGSKRDQLGFNYAAARSGIGWRYVLERAFTPRTHPAFAHVAHDGGVGSAQRLVEALDVAPVDPYTPREPSPEAPTPDSASLILLVPDHVEDAFTTLQSLGLAAGSMRLTVTLVCDPAAAEAMSACASQGDDAVSVSMDASGADVSRLNAAVEAAQDGLVFVLTAGVTLAPEALAHMARAVIHTPGAGLVSPLSANAAFHEGGDAGVTPRLPSVSGACFGFLKAAFRAAQPFDENFTLGSGWDVDFSMRAADAGFHAILATRACAVIPEPEISNAEIFMARRRLAARHGLRRIVRAGASLRSAPLADCLRKAPGADLPRPTALRRGSARPDASH